MKTPGLQNTIDPVISIKGLYKSFDDLFVLKGIDMRLNSYENLAILGRSGTGKSVLIRCIAGLEKFEEGRIEVFGKDISTLSIFELNDLRKEIGFLFQGGALYDSMSVEDNLLFPLRRNAAQLSDAEKNDLVDDVLESVGLLEARLKMPSELSGGMRKRAGLARTLVLKPKIILYDEPTTGLDPFTSRGISELIVKVKEKYKTTAIIVTHDMKCARTTADRMIIMDQGTILAEGKYRDLQHNENATVQGFFN
jgi:phospholipid/cholesterol/gamma-HCH transport system ATP-binding protein